ncbi:MAG: tRNA (guanosine(37)-N1)-methyltransferase TrmD [Calditrichaeota bacterium]|nr:tRNA (guanosine(37)-N1)-methyltransferase TrmD [Calditrichota bacterium]MCB0294728.1 tRNA (guanosine(37)-N1)-methyltransferase TrmD [Calditrichota bacterium]MCB0304185.1 tRNA (guanosine(37)-N1)-methyltransferase TrmD [Calditrichota bacterium]MCB0313711.1 tRNA (guanosine(37)-N1)-methyltransferase TrmD [Calditrichota bacterium]MCB9090017.1 tRNA (guanosine(37)-N1)-methyltransferase TrmD [Calditrichia bacterium]
MRIDVLTAFPKILQDPLDESILKQARSRIGLEIHLRDIRDYATDKHRTIDDTPYGGGPGMVFKPEPLFDALEAIFRQTGDRTDARVIFPSPQGRLFSQEIAQEFAEIPHLVFICGHYKGIDQRVIDTWVSDELSIGDYVLSGGEIPALLMIDGIVRLIPGAINDLASAQTDSFQDGLLDCPYYTRPESYRGMAVPEVLLSGHHQKIAEWRLAQRIEHTRIKRPDLYQQFLEKEKEQLKKKSDAKQKK